MIKILRDFFMKRKVKALSKALDAGYSGNSKGEVLQIEPLSYRYTERGNPYLYRHISGTVIIPYCKEQISN